MRNLNCEPMGVWNSKRKQKSAAQNERRSPEEREKQRNRTDPCSRQATKKHAPADTSSVAGISSLHLQAGLAAVTNHRKIT